MEKFKINGPNTLSGEIAVSGAKNLALKLFGAAVLINGECRFRNVPDIADVKVMGAILEDLGGKVEFNNDGEVVVDSRGINKTELDPKLSAKVRTSIMFVTPLLARFGEATFTLPGGDKIGQRPINIFLDGFLALGAEIKRNGETYHIKVEKFQGTEIVFPWITNTTTESLILAAVTARGKTRFVNCPLEPEVQGLCQFLRERGAKIAGDGTPVIEIEGGTKLNGGEYTVLPDRIETGTFALLGALSRGDIVIKNANPSHLEVFWTHLKIAGVSFDIKGQDIYIKGSRDSLKPTEIRTHEYPGFPTDLQPIFTLLMTQAKGTSLIYETIHKGRLFYTDNLNKMGAKIIMCDPHRVVVSGPTTLWGTRIESPDIRAGITMVLAAIMAEGESEIFNIYQIDRGYEKIDGRLQALGADIKREKVS